jgi:hypothetical protein
VEIWEMHRHPHSHEASEEDYAGRRHSEAVVLDIGEDVGALIVHTDAGMLGVEVELSATGQDDGRSHKDVLEREVNGRPAYTAVFDKIREGSYTLWVDGVARARNVAITGSSVAELDWSVDRTPPPDDPRAVPPRRQLAAPQHEPATPVASDGAAVVAPGKTPEAPLAA